MTPGDKHFERARLIVSDFEFGHRAITDSNHLGDIKRDLLQRLIAQALSERDEEIEPLRSIRQIQEVAFELSDKAREALIKDREQLRAALGIISRNGCCDTCQEAKLFALKALAESDKLEGTT